MGRGKGEGGRDWYGPQWPGPCIDPLWGDIDHVGKLLSLAAWQQGRTLAREAYRLTLSGPLEQHRGLTDQIRRAACAIPANITEGYALGTKAQFIRCLRIALGSATELHTHLDLATGFHLITGDQAAEVMPLADRVIGLIIGLLRSLNARPPT